MKFRILRAGGYMESSEKNLCGLLKVLEKFNYVGDKNCFYQAGDIEINSLEELLSLEKQISDCYNGLKYDGIIITDNYIEIYDDWRE